MIPDWLSITPQSGTRNGKLTFSAEPNEGLDRSASIAITLANGNSKTIRVSQEGLLTVYAELVNPFAKMYATIQDDELYDYFNQIKRFVITFSGYSLITDAITLKTASYSEDGEDCFSEYMDKEKYNMAISIRFVAHRLLSEDKKYIQVSAQM